MIKLKWLRFQSAPLDQAHGRVQSSMNRSAAQIVARICKASCLYFGLVFGAGFLFGAVRVPLLVPRLGVRVAELLEMPLMLLVVIIAARHVVRRFDLFLATGECVGIGLSALALMIGAELCLAALMQGRPLAQYIAGRDPVSGGAYLALLCLYAAMPWVIARTRPHPSR
jgi:hypothetical protein